MANPKQFIWTDPVNNTDGSNVANTEITGYQIGIRNVAGTNVGNYSIFAVVANSSATTEAINAIGVTLTTATYNAAIQTLSVTNGNSAWSNEISFIWTSTAAPLPPSGFSVA